MAFKTMFCLLLPVALTTFIFSIVFIFQYKAFDIDNKLFSEIENNINNKLIYSFRRSIICDLDETKLVFGNWDGTKVGCHCEGMIYEGECAEDLIKQGCKSIPAHNKINYSMINSKYICTKSSSTTYKELLLKTNQIIEKNQICPNNYKSCGQIDTLGRKFCVKKEDSCPINKKIIEHSDYKEDLENFFDIGHLGYNNSSDDEEGQILSIFKINQNLPCLNPSEKFWDYHYILEPDNQRCKTEIKNEVYDKRYELLSNYTLSKYDLYKENSIMEKMPYIDEASLNKIKNDKVYLFGRNFIGFDTNFLEKFDYNTLISKQNKSNNCNLAMLIILILILAIILLAFIIYISILLKINQCSLLDKCGLNCEGCQELKCEFTTFLKVGFAFLVILHLIFFIICCIIIDCIRKIQSILDIDGSDEFLCELVKQFFEEYSVNKTFSLVIIILFCMQLPAFICGICYAHCCDGDACSNCCDDCDFSDKGDF